MRNLKQALSALHDDWNELIDSERVSHDPLFLRKVADDIKKLDQEAKEAAKTPELKDSAKLVHFALSTPWGAPFVGETTLLDAATTYKDDSSNSSLQHLLTDFSHYAHAEQSPLQKVFEEILDELEDE